MKIRFEFLPTKEMATETVIVDADKIEKTDRWIIALKDEEIVFATKENYIKYVWLYKEKNNEISI